jgi:hypothetical protein
MCAQENKYCIKIHTSENEVIDLLIKKEDLSSALSKLKSSEVIEAGANGFWIPSEKIKFALIVDMNISPDPIDMGDQVIDETVPQ